jgi:hypothetical protein
MTPISKIAGPSRETDHAETTAAVDHLAGCVRLADSAPNDGDDRDECGQS